MSYVTTQFPNPINSAFKPAFIDAARFWNNVILSGSGGFTFTATTNAAQFCGVNFVYPAGSRINGLDIFALVEPIDGPGSILGSAGPCANLGNFPVLGVMRFDSADSQGLLNAGSFGEVIVHEMGHVIGIGTIWQGLVSGRCQGGGPCDPRYTGAGGIEGFRNLGGSGTVPVANTGGGGTINAHWREGFFQNELMTGFLDSGVRNPLSIMTIKSLRDLGYQVNTGAAEEYSIPSEFMRPLDVDKLQMFGDILEFDVQDIVDIEGNAVPALRGVDDDVEGSLHGVLAFMMFGFALLALMLYTMQRSQQKLILALRSNSPTETPIIKREK